MPRTADALESAAAALTDSISRAIHEQTLRVLRRRGAVVALSGGVDSALCTALAARALGGERVLALAMPEAESDAESLSLARACAERLGVSLLVEEITPVLEACGCYRRRDQAVRRVVPEYGPGWTMKLGLPGLGQDRLNVTRLVVCPPGGEPRGVRLSAEAYRAIVAATNFKQRVRAMLAYHHADRLHYAVVGTPNRLEYDQGFFVRGGDGLADLKPIAHLYKDEVYMLARHLNVPEEILRRTPTTDTFPLAQTQEEFYFALPLGTVNALLRAQNRGCTPAEAARALGIPEALAARGMEDIRRKREATRHLHTPPLLAEPVAEVMPLDGGAR